MDAPRTEPHARDASRAPRSEPHTRDPRHARDARSPLLVRDAGRIGYAAAHAWQQRLVDERARDASGDVVLLCEHESVITRGRGTSADFLLIPRFPVVDVERGGEATYHGPGQIVAYPIVALAEGRRDLHAWMRALEQAGLDALAACGLPAARRPGATGVWTSDGERKLMSIGVAARRWITWHGLALNHDPDLSHFGVIRPCGFGAEVMTSVRAELGAACPSRATLAAALVDALHVAIAPFRVDGEGAP